ncbi:unnamed protein product [Durusdinium trenchii]|uniref:non-specific serine/threonine protein kinase n=2 Tax=Durusdinium trenchii TaxID=1381693 RepID=A0ABP0SB33_9DINO
MSAMPKVGLAAAGPAKSKPRGSREKAEQNADADAPIGKFNPSQYYEEIRHLGSGAFGAAVLVRRLKDGRRLVAKKCSVKDMEEKQRRMCFEEIALLQKVRHECVAQLVDFVWASKDMLSYWIVLKFYPGGDVQSEIDTCRENQLELPIGKVKNWVTQLCMALKHVHKLRIVHRDVKGSNMFISGARNIVLGDFGVSKQLTESEQKAMTSVGSPMYMAPEWWDGRGGTANSDMWSVGVVLFELMALHRPFEAQNVLSLVHKITTEEPAALPEDADPQLSSLAMQLLDKRPERRPSAAEVLQAKGLEDAEKILQIYREALEKKSDRHQRRLAREEDAAAGKRPRRFSRSSSMSSECESSGNAAGFRGINLVDIARRQAGVVPKFQEEGASEDEEDEESSEWDEDEEEEEAAESESALSSEMDSWHGAAVEDPECLGEVLAGTSHNLPDSGCTCFHLQADSLGNLLEKTPKEKSEVTLVPASVDQDIPARRTSPSDTLTFTSSEQSTLDKETNFSITQSQLVTRQAIEKTRFPDAKQVPASAKAEAAVEVTSFPAKPQVSVPEITVVPEITTCPTAKAKSQPEPRPTLTTSSGSDSWADARAFQTAGLEGEDAMSAANSKTLQVRHQKKEKEETSAAIAVDSDEEDSQEEEEEEEEEKTEDEEDEEEEDHEIEEEVEVQDEAAESPEEDQEDEHIEEAIDMDKTRNPADVAPNELRATQASGGCRSQPTFSVAPPLEDGEESPRQTGTARVSSTGWQVAGDGVRPRSISEDVDSYFRSSCTRTTFRSSRSEGLTADSTGSWVRRTTLAAMSGALHTRPDQAQVMDFHAPPREVKSREAKQAVLATAAYPSTDGDVLQPGAPDSPGSSVRLAFRGAHRLQGGRRCVTLYESGREREVAVRSQSLGSAPRDTSRVLGLNNEAISLTIRPQTTDSPRGSLQVSQGNLGAAHGAKVLQPLLQSSTKSLKSPGDVLGNPRVEKPSVPASSCRSASERELRSKPPSGLSRLGTRKVCL